LDGAVALDTSPQDTDQWQTLSPAWVARHGMTSGEYQTEFNSLVSQGFRLIDVSGY
jgi:hypothetical protein